MILLALLAGRAICLQHLSIPIILTAYALKTPNQPRPLGAAKPGERQRQAGNSYATPKYFAPLAFMAPDAVRLMRYVMAPQGLSNMRGICSTASTATIFAAS